jgi:hypothetical protein
VGVGLAGTSSKVPGAVQALSTRTREMLKQMDRRVIGWQFIYQDYTNLNI